MTNTDKQISKLSQQRDSALATFDKMTGVRIDTHVAMMQKYAREIYEHLNQVMTPYVAADDHFQEKYDMLTPTEKNKFSEILDWAVDTPVRYDFVAQRYEMLDNKQVSCIWNEYKHPFQDQSLFTIFEQTYPRSKNITLARQTPTAIRTVSVPDTLAEKLVSSINMARLFHLRKFVKYQNPDNKTNWIWLCKPENMYTLEYNDILFPVDISSSVMQRPAMKRMMDECIESQNMLKYYAAQRNAIVAPYNDRIARLKTR